MSRVMDPAFLIGLSTGLAIAEEALRYPCESISDSTLPEELRTAGLEIRERHFKDIRLAWQASLKDLRELLPPPDDELVAESRRITTRALAQLDQDFARIAEERRTT